MEFEVRASNFGVSLGANSRPRFTNLKNSELLENSELVKTLSVRRDGWREVGIGSSTFGRNSEVREERPKTGVGPKTVP